MRLLRQGRVLYGQGTSVADAIRQLAISFAASRLADDPVRTRNGLPCQTIPIFHRIRV